MHHLTIAIFAVMAALFWPELPSFTFEYIGVTA